MKTHPPEGKYGVHLPRIINKGFCSGMIACACGMSKWLVECEWMSEWSVDGMNVIVLHIPYHGTSPQGHLSMCEILRQYKQTGFCGLRFCGN